MRITAEAWLTAMFRFFGDALSDREKSETASWLIDELEDATGIEFSPDEKKELSGEVKKLLSEKTSVRDVKDFISNLRNRKSPSVAVFLLSPKAVKTTNSINLSFFLCCCPSKEKYQLTEDGTKIPLPDGRGIIRKTIKDN
jgi:hypothetical protein